MPAQSYATIRKETGDLSPPAGDVRSIVPIIPSCQATYHKCEGAVGPVEKKKKKKNISGKTVRQPQVNLTKPAPLCRECGFFGTGIMGAEKQLSGAQI